MWLLPGILALLLLCFAVFRPVYIYFKDEKGLRKFHAPAFAGMSNWWSFYVQRKSARTRFVHAAHAKYGPVVRIQPNHLSFTAPQAVMDIYSFQSGMMKDEHYETFSGEDFSGKNERSITNTRDRLVHARKRKFSSSAFAQRNVVNFDSIVHAVILQLTSRFDSFCDNGPPAYPGSPKPGFLNLYKWINLFTYDAIGEIAFGQSFGFLEMGDDLATAETGDGKQYQTHVITTFQGSSEYDMLASCWATLIHPIKRWTWFMQGNKDGAVFMDVVNYKVRERLRNGKPDSFRDFFENFRSDNKGSIESEYSEISRESNIFIAAGNDTSATAMTNVMFLLISNPRVMNKLREEVDPIMKADGDGAFNYEQVKDSKYLKACLDEGMRRRPPVSMGLGREVPKGGATIAGHYVAEGVSVSVPAWSVHHDPAVFSDPFEYRPERWLETEGAQKKAMMDSFMPFSVGPRACIGRNLAYFEQQVSVATSIHRYDFEMVRPDYELPVCERSNANPDQFWVRVTRRKFA